MTNYFLEVKVFGESLDDGPALPSGTLLEMQMDDVASHLLPLAGIFVHLGAALELVFAADDQITFVGVEFGIGVGLLNFLLLLLSLNLAHL